MKSAPELPTLIITYRELRLLEIEVLREIYRAELARMKGGATELPLQSLLKLDDGPHHEHAGQPGIWRGLPADSR